jgi:DNA end-binding protein Ku
MPRPIWDGHITFGLVTIPVRLFSAEDREAALHFHLLDGRDLSPIRQLRVNERTGEEVPWAEVVKGFEYESGSYVVLEPDDFARANVEATKSIEIVQVSCADEIDPAFFARPYYLEPAKAGVKPYALLRETLRRQKKAAIAKMVLRTREHLALVYPRGDALALSMMRYAAELRDDSSLELPGTELGELGVAEKELELAGQLVDSLTEAWDPEAHTDTYRDDLKRLIDEKLEAGDTYEPEPLPTATEPTSEVVDIMDLLKKSVEEAGSA